MDKSTEWTDQEILEAISRSKQVDKAIRQLYEGYYGMMQHYILQNGGSKADAAETVQETILVFLNLIETKRFRGEESIHSVLYGINRDVWLTTLRKRKSRANSQQEYPNDQEREFQDISKTINELEGYQLIMSLFSKLGEKCQRLVNLYYYENLTEKEIAEQEGYTSEQDVRDKKCRCMTQLVNQVEADENLYGLVRNALEYGK